MCLSRKSKGDMKDLLHSKLLDPKNFRTYPVLSLSALALLTGSAAFGQGAADGMTVAVVDGPNLFMAILIGFILAVGIQLVLTQFSLAFGIANIGDLSAPADPDKKGQRNWSLDKLCSTLGAWGLITASLSLFAASYLAITLVPTATLVAAGVMGLVIWAVFMVAMTILEANAINSLVGSLIATATSGLRGFYNATTGMFSKSPDRKLADTAATITASVRDEILGTRGVNGMRKELRNYFRGFDSRTWNPDRLKEGILSILDDTEIEAVVDDSPQDEDEGSVVAKLRFHSQQHNGRNGERLKKLNEAIYKIQHEAHSRKDLPSKIFDGAYQLTGKSSAEAQATREMVEAYLLETEREELEPTAIKQEFGTPLEGSQRRVPKFQTTHRAHGPRHSLLGLGSPLGSHPGRGGDDCQWHRRRRGRGQWQEPGAHRGHEGSSRGKNRRLPRQPGAPRTLARRDRGRYPPDLRRSKDRPPR